MSEQKAFAVPKDRQAARIYLEKGASVEGDIFLEYYPGELTLHQKIATFLESKNQFFPFLARGAAKAEIINKKSLKMLEVDYPEHTEMSALSFSLMHIENITAVFNDGDSISGDLMAEVPLEKARLSDCLNIQFAFLSIKKEEKVYYVNKEAVRKVMYADKA